MSRSTILVSAGVGPAEVRRFVALLARELADECQMGGLRVRSVTVHGDERAPRSVELEVEGNAAAVMQESLGTHVLVAQSPSRGRRARKRWFAGVSLHVAQRVTSVVAIDPRDVEVTTARAGGPGGQHVNTTDSAVRIRHRPSGICIRVASERSQHRNRSHALARLATILTKRDDAKNKTRNRGLRRSHYRFERGSAVKQWVVDKRSGALRTARLLSVEHLQHPVRV